MSGMTIRWFAAWATIISGLAVIRCCSTIHIIDLSGYDGVLAFGQIIRDIYLSKGWTDHAWTWHEAADTRIFQPLDNDQPEGDLIWIGNWGDDERTAELQEFLTDPVKQLGLKARVHGVRYPTLAVKLFKTQESIMPDGSRTIRFLKHLPAIRSRCIFQDVRMSRHCLEFQLSESSRLLPAVSRLSPHLGVIQNGSLLPVRTT